MHNLSSVIFYPVVIALLLVTLPAAATERLSIPGITGQDDRVVVKTMAYPWHAIGRVNNTLGPYCTGTLIGPHHVLTAAHCLWNRRTENWLPPCALHFVAGYQGGNYLGHSLIVSYQLSGSDILPRKGLPIDPTKDWAVLTLAKDLSKVAGFLPSIRLVPALMHTIKLQRGVFLQAGYSRDKSHILTLNKPCKLTRFMLDGRLVQHECDTTFGDSGSPILLERNGKYHIAAVLVGINKHADKGIAVTGKAFHEYLQALEPPAPNHGTIKACQASAAIDNITLK